MYAPLVPGLVVGYEWPMMGGICFGECGMMTPSMLLIRRISRRKVASSAAVLR